MIEEWRNVPGYQGRYSASSLGRIRGVRGQCLTPVLSHTGYYVCGLYDHNGKQRVHLWHKVIALTFHGPRPDGKNICHNDGDPSNNAAINLRYDTQKGNLADRSSHGTELLGEARPNAKLNDLKVKWIRQNAGSIPLGRMARKLGVSHTTVRAVVQNKMWKHIT